MVWVETLASFERSKTPHCNAARAMRHCTLPTLARASWFRGVSALPNSFAHESFIDELATAAKVDPVEYRLRYISWTVTRRLPNA